MSKVLKLKDKEFFLIVRNTGNGHKTDNSNNKIAATKFSEEEAIVFTKFFPEYEVVNYEPGWGIFSAGEVLSERYTGTLSFTFEINTKKAISFSSRTDAERFLNAMKLLPDSNHYFDGAYVEEIKD